MQTSVENRRTQRTKRTKRTEELKEPKEPKEPKNENDHDYVKQLEVYNQQRGLFYKLQGEN